MGTYTLADSITGEPIKEGEKVVAMLLSHAESESFTAFLYANPEDRYRFASLPISGTWDGSVVDADDDESIAVRSANYATNLPELGFSELHGELYTESVRKIPDPWAGKLGSIREADPKPVQFSMFVAKPSSIELLVENKALLKRFKSTAEQGLLEVKALVERMVEVDKGFASPDEEVRMDAYGRLMNLAKAVFFETSQTTVEDLPVPAAARSLASCESSPFSDRLSFFLRSENLYSTNAMGTFRRTKTLPDAYEEVFNAMHETNLLVIAMKFLSVPLVPAAGRGGSWKDADRIQLLQSMLVNEITRYIEDVSEDTDADDLKRVDDILSPLRKEVAGLVKLRNEFEADVEKYQARTRR